ncbi:MAG TPA: type II toxin-antitoxin system HicB family antitoxin [Candidatus Kapabacteria bacterium]|nr:type II toxin-antitoxin system HicB family antitoxin [Candidatus Kapabacteria bacterium]
MKFNFTMSFISVPEGFIGYVEELPGANSQGITLEETRKNLYEAIDLILEANKYLFNIEKLNLVHQEHLELIEA